MNSTFEKELKEKGYLVYHNVGDSMMPLIKQGRDLMVLESIKRPVKKYDAVLYKSEDGRYIMHRIIGKNDSGFILRGDNRYENEYGIKNEQILALLTAVIRDGKEIKCESLKYKFYVHLWYKLYFLRKFIFKLKKYI